MKERPILFNGPMVRAILSGQKTQTRRIVKPQPFFADDPAMKARIVHPGVAIIGVLAVVGVGDEWKCPHGQPGDRLWVRETWQGPLLTDCDEFEAYRESPDDFKTPAYCEYAADGGPTPEFMTDDDKLVSRWIPSIFMPRWACRVTLEITAVRVERLQDISDADALAEGVDRTNTSISGYAKERYRKLWGSINGPDSWDKNPWVWVIEFGRVP